MNFTELNINTQSCVRSIIATNEDRGMERGWGGRKLQSQFSFNGIDSIVAYNGRRYLYKDLTPEYTFN